MSDIQNLLSKIQQELKAPKGQYNSFSKYNYRSCEDILSAVKPLLGDAFITLSDEMVEVGGRVYVKATATIHTGSAQLSVTAFARESDQRKGMNSDQLTGATSSYARKYALNGLLLIDDNKDSDTTDHRQQGAAKTTTKAKPALESITPDEYWKLSKNDQLAKWNVLDQPSKDKILATSNGS